MIELRLFLLVPALSLAVALISLRTFRLHLPGAWSWRTSGIITLIMAQITSAAYYLPVSPLAFGLVLLGLAYGLINLFRNLDERTHWSSFPILAVGLII